MSESGLIAKQFEAVLGEKVSTRPSELEQHGRDENYAAPARPLAVVYAESVNDVVTALEAARRASVHVIPYGTGTSAEGRVVPIGPAVTLDMSGMNRIISILPGDFLAIIEPGVTRNQLNAALRDHGLFFPVDPGADASLGGMAATNASGTTTVRYGGMRANVASLQVVLANGESLELGRPVRKSSSGYALRDLFIGSGGTLGVITQLTVHLHPVPDDIAAMQVAFPSVPAAAQAAYAVMGAALPVARLELVDAGSMRALNKFLGTSFATSPALFVELHSSSPEALASELAGTEQLMAQYGGEVIATALRSDERVALWNARHQLYWAVRAWWPGREYLIGDAAVPLSAMPELVAFIEETMRRLGLDGVIAGHAGDGNVHSLVAAIPGDPRPAEFSELVVRRALALRGTCTGEHGIGVVKLKYLDEEHGPARQWMRKVKELFDPEGLLNPGKDI